MEYRLDLFDLLICLSEITDWISPELNNHHKQCAVISVLLGKAMGLSHKEISTLASAAVVHDIGAVSLEERIRLLNFEEENPESHASAGSKLLKMFEPLAQGAEIVKYHHTPFNRSNGLNVPLSSQILMLADHIAALIHNTKNVLNQSESIRACISKDSGVLFNPEVVKVFMEESKRPSFWLDALFPAAERLLRQLIDFPIHVMDDKGLMSFARFISKIIDFRSKFTAAHSSGVAAVAEYIGVLMGLAPHDCFELKVAGLLHDLGKLAVPSEILEKPAKLTPEEFNVMRGHTYYTYRSLEPFTDLLEITKTAAYHHEHLDGTGYPFGITAKDLSVPARIMAVADVFTALTENRPYRSGMADPMPILRQMSGHKLDPDIVKLADKNFEKINEVRKQAQKDALDGYKHFEP